MNFLIFHFLLHVFAQIFHVLIYFDYALAERARLNILAI